MISWAQNFEDVILARAFAGRRDGFYVDIGAFDPDEASVTRHFYDMGWRGINVEPQAEPFARLTAARPEDVNLRVAIARESGTITIWRGPSPGESTAIRPDTPGDSFDVSCLTLAELCRRHVTRPIDFLKIDVEGLEADVIAGGDWERYRPSVVVVEVTKPWTTQRRDDAATIGEALRAVRYDEVWFDGLNAYYVAQEARHLAAQLALPPNVLDGFVTATQAKLAEDLGAARALAELAAKDSSEARELARSAEQARRAQSEELARLLAEASRAQARQAKLAEDLGAARALAELAAKDSGEARELARSAEEARRAQSEEAARLLAEAGQAQATQALAFARSVDLLEQQVQESARLLAEAGQAQATQALAFARSVDLLEQQVQESAQRAEEASKELATARAIAHHWQGRARHAEDSFAAMESSRSWRLTAPLRALLRLCRPSGAAPGGSAAGAMQTSFASVLTSIRRSGWFARYAPAVRQRFPRLWMKGKRFVAERGALAQPAASTSASVSVALASPASQHSLVPASADGGQNNFAARLAAEVRRQRGVR